MAITWFVRVLAVGILPLLCLLTGCSSSTEEATIPVSTAVERDDVRLFLGLNGSRFDASDAIRLHAEVANMGWRTADYVTPNIGDPKIALALRAKDDDSWQILYGPEFKGALTAIDRLTLDPGQVIVRDYEWPKQLRDADGVYRPAGTGIYIVEAVFWLQDLSEEDKIVAQLEFSYTSGR